MLHDAVLNHFFLGQLTEAAYVDEFVYNYGEWNRALGTRIVARRARRRRPTSVIFAIRC